MASSKPLGDTTGHFKATLLSHNVNGIEVPVAIKIEDNPKDSTTKIAKKTDLIFYLDAPDSMGFGNIPPLVSPHAVKFLLDTLKKYYGGKNMFTVPAELVGSMEAWGFHAKPELPNRPYDRLMQADFTKIKNYLDVIRLPKTLDSEYEFITDKSELIRAADEISELFLRRYEGQKSTDAPIQNAPFAFDEKKRQQYSQAAMAARLDNDAVFAAALRSKKTGKIIGFIRGYDQKQMGMYVSDLLVDMPSRNLSPMLLLMKMSLETVKDKPPEKLFLIAGDEAEKKFYKKMGFASLSQTPTTSNNKQIMVGLLPPENMKLQDDLKTQMGKSLPAEMPVPLPNPKSLGR